MDTLKEYIKEKCSVTLRPTELSYLSRRVFEVLGCTVKDYICQYKDLKGHCDIEIIFFDGLLEDIRHHGIDSLRVELINYLYEANPYFEDYLNTD